MTLGYAPEEIEVPLTGRPDLKPFWAEALDELRSVPPRFQITHQPAQSDESRNLYVVEMRSLDDVRVRDTWKLIQIGEETLLFDLKNDPTETSNVASQQPKLVAKLKKSLAPYVAMIQQNSRRRR